MKKLLLLVLLALGKAASAEIVIALVSDGANGGAVLQLIQAASFAVETLNAQGGLLGQKLRYVYFDDSCSAEVAEIVAKRVVEQHASLVIGHNCSAASKSAAPIYAASGIVQITPYSTSPALTEMGIKSVFRLIGRDDQAGNAAVAFILQRWPRGRIGIVDDGELYGSGIAERVKSGLAEKGVTPVLLGHYRFGSNDFTGLAADVVKRQVDAVYVGGYINDIHLFANALSRAKSRATIISSDDAFDRAVYSVEPGPLEGLMFPAVRDAYSFAQAGSYADMAKKRGAAPAAHAPRIFAAIEVWSAAVAMAGTADGAAVADLMHRGTFHTLQGEISFDDKGDVRGPLSEWVWYRVEKSRPVPVTPPGR